MKYLGAHIDALPLAAIPRLAHDLGAEAFAFCPVDARRWTDAPYAASDIDAFRQACEDYRFSANQILAHASLLLNPCSPDARKLKLSRVSLAAQMEKCAQLGLSMLNFHPGATIKEISEDEAVRLAAETINYALEKTQGVTAVIENTAGQGSNIGYSFEHIAQIIDGVEDKSRVGVCIDTCHASAAGYSFASKEDYEASWAKFDSTIGFAYLRGMHINDSVRPTGSRIDRHAPIGKGTLGNDFFALLMSDPRIDGIPLILETPDPSLWQMEIDWLRARTTN